MPRYLCISLTLLALAGCRTGRNYPDPAGPRFRDSVLVASPGADTDTLRIASFNIEFARRVDSAIALLQSDSVLRRSDVVLLQEMDAAGTQRVAESLGMAYVYYPAIYHNRVRHDFGNALDVRGSRRRDQLRAIIADAARYPRVVIGGDLNDHDVGRVARNLGYAWPTESGPRTTSLGRWDHIFLKGLGSPPTNASGTVLDAYRISDHRPVWVIAILP